ncbi:hypothetical protein O181_032403 [Austropuccinia psidii MF-1]|uniref:CCHC-type domain-containing protein n=1 Tax=Austropuccinia psidii MF-1 TaxID=1389203 RepID=A0A9Q3D1I6_9BASI|nr:hypothetical protein [Austropuccinia psidii MF-1]
MEHGQQEVQPGIPLGRAWRKLPEDLSQRDRLQRPYCNHQRLESHQKVQTSGGEGNQDKGESSHYPSYRRTADPDRAYSDSLRLTRSRPKQLSSSLTPFRNQQISVKESPFLTIPGSFQEKTMIQGQKQDLLQPKAERVRPNDPESVGLCERSKKEPKMVVHTSRISILINRNITPTQTEHNVVTPENEESQTPDTNARRARACNKPRERVAEVANKENSCHKCGSTDHYAKNCQKAKKKVYAIEKVLEEESPTEDSESDSMGNAIREQSDDDQDPREELLVEYKEETPLEIQDIQLEAGMPQDTANKNLCEDTQDAQTLPVTSTKRMA